MTLTEVYRACLNMKPGDKRNFTLDQDPGDMAAILLTAQLSQYHKVGIVVNKSGQKIDVWFPPQEKN